MKKITTLGIAALLALALAACDKGDKQPEVLKTETPQSEPAQPAPSESATEAPTAEAPKVAQTEMPMKPAPEDSIEISAEPTKEGAEDYKRLMQWEEVQEQKLGELGIKIQQQVQEAMTTKAIPAGLEDNIKQYKASLEEVNKSLENLSIDDPEIKALAAKKRELYSFSGEGLLLSVNVMTSEDQSPEFIQKFEKQIGELSNKVNQLNTHIGKAEAALDKKYPRQ